MLLTLPVRRHCLASFTPSSRPRVFFVRRYLSSSSSTSSLEGPPQSALVPPGNCQFGEDFQSVPLLNRSAVSPTSSVLRFALPNSSQPLNLSTCACLLARAPSSINDEDVVIRPYTPISTNAQIGSFDLLIKDYGQKGNLSRYMHSIEVGETIDFKHIPPNVKIQAPFVQKRRIVMLAGGTGITPMIQALHAILGEKDDDQHVTLLYGSQNSDDVLAKDLLDRWAKDYSDRFQMVHVLSNKTTKEETSSSWAGRHGVIDKSLLEEFLPPPNNDDTLILVCGPPPMYEALCGPREEPEQVTGVLAQLGFTANQVYKF